MIEYHSDLGQISPDDLGGFFVGGPRPPSAATHYRLLAASSEFGVAKESESSRVIGYITALSDGVLSAYIPHLEVRSEFRHRGIGSQLVREVLDRLGEIYRIDRMCDEDVRPFYEKLGLTPSGGMMRRNYANQSGL